MRSTAITVVLVLQVVGTVPSGTFAAGEPTVQEVVFRAEWDGRDERYLMVLPAGFDPQQSHDLLLALHGHGSDRRQFVEQPRDECRAARDTAAKHQLILISPDYRAPTSWMGPAAAADVKQIIVETKRKLKIGHVIISGGSMGGTSSLAFAALHPELIDGVVAMNGTANLVEYENFQDAIRSSYGGTKEEVPDEYRRRSAELWPERLTMPIACTTGGRDRAVPPASVERLMTALHKLGRPVLHLHREAGGHSTNYADAIEAYEFVLQRVSRSKQ